MRLFLCVLGSLALHSLLFVSSSREVVGPTLAVSMIPRTVDLKIVTRVKPEPVAVPSKPEPEQVVTPPPPKPKPKPKVVKRKPKPKPQPKKKEVQQTKPQPSSYSSAPKKPRLVERSEYLSNPPPKYPDFARRRGQEGIVMLLVDVAADGRTSRVEVLKSSGHSRLDHAARKAVARWRFTPATVEGQAVSSQVRVPIRFSLRSGD